MHINIIYDSRNYTIILDEITNYVWLYSFQKPICYFDLNQNRLNIVGKIETQTNKFHLRNFRKFLKID